MIGGGFGLELTIDLQLIDEVKAEFRYDTFFLSLFRFFYQCGI